MRFNPSEIAELDRQAPKTKSYGGWQQLLVTLQDQLDRSSGCLVLSPPLLERIQRYAFRYRNGGWQARLKRIFGRTLGPTLGGGRLRPAA